MSNSSTYVANEAAKKAEDFARPRGLYVAFGKRIFDLLISAGVLIVFGWLMALIAILIKWEDPGPVLYRQERIGKDGKAFKLTKFRSMCIGAEHKGAGILVEKNDSRITRVGRIIRKLSLDELTQIFDVIRGDMSIVGPRPGLRYQAELYDASQWRRLHVKPGITGWAQVNGRNSIIWPERIRLDVEYVEKISFLKDIEVILKTIPSVLLGSNQIAGGDYWKQRRAELEKVRGGIEQESASESSAEDVPEEELEKQP